MYWSGERGAGTGPASKDEELYGKAGAQAWARAKRSATLSQRTVFHQAFR